jgi:hypothetical protein
MKPDHPSAEEWAEKIADDIANNRHSYLKHCQQGRELMQLDGQPATREQYHDLIKRTLLDPKAAGRSLGGDKSTLCIYSHETRMVVVVCPRMTGDASTAYPLSDKAPVKMEFATDLHSHALDKKSIHGGLIYNHGDGFPRNARETFQSRFEVRDITGRFTGKNRSGDPVQPITGADRPFAEWLKIRAVPQKLSQYFGAHAAGNHAPAQTYRHTPGYALH